VKRDWLVYLVIFSLALNLGTIGTFAYLRYQDNREKTAVQVPPRPLLMRSLWRELKLDDAQRQTVRRLFPEHHQRVGSIRRDLAQKRQELFELIKEESTPWSAIQAKIQEISALQGSLEEEMARFLLEFKKNLNPTQYAAFLNLVQARLGRGLRGSCGPEGPGGGHRRGPPGMGRGMGPRACPPN
jgi:Spy/CpxP family protein refolding chaperone